MTMFVDYRGQLTNYENQFATLVNSFLSEYDTLVTAAAFQLGDLFNREDYPTRDMIENKFGFRYSLLPLPQAGDFRVDVGNDGLKELQDQYERVMEQRVVGAMTEAWERLHDCLSRMSERLTDATDENGDPKRKIFRDSLMTNAYELCDLLSKLNVTNDPKLEQARQALEQAVDGKSAEQLRKSDEMRLQTKAKVDEILGMF